MIKKFIFPLIAIILLSSCANKFSVQKRKYNKGFYLGMSSDHRKNTEHSSPSRLKAKPNHLQVAEATQNEIVSAPVNIEVLPIASEIQNNKTLLKPKHDKQVLAAANNKLVKEEKEFRNIEVKSPATNSKAKKGSSDTNLIIMIILCLFPFICLIPVFLHDGKSITLNFWIDLLLHLTFIGEIIFALLVVLDVVDLA